ncbi:MAG: hypothetical protein Q9179_000079 [Wetmoreana sp. 5 TL-2023]
MRSPSVESNDSLARESRDFLKDFALVASGPGGPDNVSAACMEISEKDDQILVLRVARNGGINDEMLCRLKGIIESVIQKISSGMSEDQTREETLLAIIKRCRSRLVKHTKVLERMLRFVGSHGSDHFNAPQTTFPDDKAESLQDVELLGKYCGATHESYMRLCKDRLKQLKDLVSRVSLSTTPSDLQDPVALTKLAYQVRRSCSFRQLVAYNVNKPQKRRVTITDLRDLVERIGQISKFYRAAVTLTSFLAKLQKLGKGVRIKAASTEKIEIPELASRTAAQVRRRGGNNFSSSSEAHIQNMINRWPAYREHVELQLIIFYEQNPKLTLSSPYIGCSKQSCYLCYNFIAEHGRFQVDGCHQSLYSLWTVRETISFTDEARASVFKKALKKLGFDLEQKVQAQKSPKWRRPGFSCHNESVANLSRVSLAYSDRSVREACFEKRTNGAIVFPADGGFGAISNKESSIVSMAELKIIPEESTEDIMEAGMSREPLKSGVALPEDSVDVAYRTSDLQVERDVIAPQSRSHAKPLAPSASVQADRVHTQGLPSIPVAQPFLDASPVDCSEDVSKERLEPQVSGRPRRKRRQRDYQHHSLQHNLRASGRSNKGGNSILDKAVTKKRRKRPAWTPEQRSRSGRPRVMHNRRKRRSSIKQRLAGIIKLVFTAFGGLERQKPRRRQKSTLFGITIA